MKAISLHQPYATAMATWLKQYETRSWKPTTAGKVDYRGDLLICATKKKMDAARTVLYHSQVKPLTDVPLAYGCALGVVEIYDCVPSEEFAPGGPRAITDTERALGDYRPGRWIWLTRRLRSFLNPVPITGRQGMFNVEININLDLYLPKAR